MHLLFLPRTIERYCNIDNTDLTVRLSQVINNIYICPIREGIFLRRIEKETIHETSEQRLLITLSI